MAINLRIFVQDTQPLDGVTELPQGISGQQSPDGVLNFFVPPGQAFGLLDPGRFLAGQTSNLRVKSLSVVPAPGNIMDGNIALAPPGEDQGIVAPGTLRRVVVDFDALGVNSPLRSGILTEGLETPIPTDYKLAFTTVSPLGPYLIQISLEPERRSVTASLPPQLGV
jgi:hypothetical protein